LTVLFSQAILCLILETMGVKYHWILVGLLGTLAIISFAPIDVADTAFDAMDTPVVLAHPALPRIRFNTPNNDRAVAPTVAVQERVRIGYVPPPQTGGLPLARSSTTLLYVSDLRHTPRQ
jgi:hypothetical protein